MRRTEEVVNDDLLVAMQSLYDKFQNEPLRPDVEYVSKPEYDWRVEGEAKGEYRSHYAWALHVRALNAARQAQ
jgi:hypothetical protein